MLVWQTSHPLMASQACNLRPPEERRPLKFNESRIHEVGGDSVYLGLLLSFSHGVRKSCSEKVGDLVEQLLKLSFHEPDCSFLFGTTSNEMRIDSSEFRRHLSSQAHVTGLWICETDQYRRWHDAPDHGSLWIKGVLGAGKPVIAASLVQHLRTTEDVPVSFIFFRNIVAANFSPRSLLQDLLAQLLPHSEFMHWTKWPPRTAFS
ncbi:hypothetical protein EJ05DRAFT_513781 [Pseudovirgaria hyperparasitica]|uniref:Nephrocystin 3-like N-terminal domain-containing protein n=1 Tax=Pseudovirgaria hyperparasitica TaxID=470096 RepID=A0A6A6VXG3_9PEZI|nr:uncharacterized protein EJ05DRAFT_513781 [Pseudovirgaria hyperparasitica]KAF2754865.1 hypothetical protein EJ05DRAFT_513781 [Pseudovirgaria hyperparasitica]